MGTPTSQPSAYFDELTDSGVKRTHGKDPLDPILSSGFGHIIKFAEALLFGRIYKAPTAAFLKVLGICWDFGQGTKQLLVGYWFKGGFGVGIVET